MEATNSPNLSPDATDSSVPPQFEPLPAISFLWFAAAAAEGDDDDESRRETRKQEPKHTTRPRPAMGKEQQEVAQSAGAGAILAKRRREGKEAARGDEPAATALSVLADDVLLQILERLEGDLRDWARASCVSSCLAALLRGTCFLQRLSRALPAELIPASSADGAPAAWAALHKLSVCFPDLLRAEAWDLYSAFCLRSFYGYHDDGEPVVRAYVRENGHVTGAWTERPLYS